MSDINLVIEDEEELKLELSSAMPKVETEELTINLNELDFADTSSVDISPSEGHYITNVVVNKDDNLKSGNVVLGVKIEGVTGTSDLGWDTSQLTDMQRMFYNHTDMTTIDFTGFDTSNVTNMQYMFYGCSGLTSIDLSNFNTSNVNSMQYMFTGCTGLTSLDLSNFDTSNVTDMQYMFNGCTGLTSLDLSNFDTSNVTSMNQMFYRCFYLTSLDLSNFKFKTNTVVGTAYMFASCSRLITLDISGLDWWLTSANVFSNCTSLTTVYVKDENSKTACDTALANAGLSIESTIKE